MNSRRSTSTYFLRPFEHLLALIEYLDTGDLPEKVWISRNLHPQDAQVTSKSGENLDSSLVSAGEQVIFGQISLILPNVHVVKARQRSGSVSQSSRPLFCWRRSCGPGRKRRCIETALFDPDPAFQNLNHLPISTAIASPQRPWIKPVLQRLSYCRARG